MHTRARYEEFVEAELIRKGIEVFTPKITLRKRWSDRIKYIEEPLFKSYRFAKFPLKEKGEILSQHGIAGIVHFSDQYIPV